MFEGILGIILSDVHPVLDLAALLLLRYPGLRDHSIEHDLPLHREKGGENGTAGLLLEGVHVRGHQSLEERVRVWATDGEDSTVRQVGHPAT